MVQRTLVTSDAVCANGLLGNAHSTGNDNESNGLDLLRLKMKTHRRLYGYASTSVFSNMDSSLSSRTMLDLPNGQSPNFWYDTCKMEALHTAPACTALPSNMNDSPAVFAAGSSYSASCPNTIARQALLPFSPVLPKLNRNMTPFLNESNLQSQFDISVGRRCTPRA